MAIRKLAVVLLVAAGLASGGCRPGTPVLDAGDKPPSVEGTVSGRVFGPDGSTPIAGREVVAIDIKSGQKHNARTNEAGGYSMKVPPGDYRLDVTLMPGESIARRPEEVHINPSDLDAQRDFVVAGQVRSPG